MKIQCETESFRDAINAVASVAAANSSKPIFGAIMIEAGDSVVMRATDGQVGMTAEVSGAAIMDAGSVVLNARALQGAIGATDSATVELRAEESGAHLACADADYDLAPIVGETMPTVAGWPDDVQSLVVDGPMLASALGRVITACNAKEVGVLAGTHIACTGERLTITATDGKYVARSELSCVGEDIGVIAPRSAVDRLRTLCDGEGVNVHLCQRDALMVARVDCEAVSYTLSTRTIDGAYPNVENAIPTGDVPAIACVASELAGAIKRVLVMAGESKGVILSMDGDWCEVSTMSANAGQGARSSFPCNWDGDPTRIGANAHYLGLMLKAYSLDTIRVEYHGKGRPLVVREPSATYVVMPINLPD